MAEFMKRLLVAIVMMILVSLFIIAGKHTVTKAEQFYAETADWIWPADGIITDIFGSRSGEHKGIDIADEPGTPVYSVDRGVVTKSYYSDTYGNVVFIKHNTGFETVYAHLSERKVKEGQSVEKGELIGLMGSTGESSGSHLHFEVHIDSWTVNKENSIDPFLIFGTSEVGEYVAAGTIGIVQAAKQVGQENSIVHTVVKEDTLWGLAEKYGTTVNSIKKWNDISDDLIFPGQEIEIIISQF